MKTMKQARRVRYSTDSGANWEEADKEAVKNPHAVALGKMKSEKKAKAARKNGKKGGRPVGSKSKKKGKGAA